MYVPPHRRKLQPSGELTPSGGGAAQGCSTERIVPTRRRPDGVGRGMEVAPERNAAGSRSSYPRFDRGKSGRRSSGEKAVAGDDDEADSAAVILLCEKLRGIKCVNMNSRRDKWEQVQRQAHRVGRPFAQKLERFEAVDGEKMLRRMQQQQESPRGEVGEVVQIEWDATRNAQYSSRVTASVKRMTAGEVGCAASHVQVWRSLSDAPEDDDAAWLILEDDCAFEGAASSRGRSQPRFVRAFHRAWEQLPEDWDLLYLGFSARGERSYLEAPSTSDDSPSSDLQVQLYRPTYGFHTHAYVVKKRAAKLLLERLPVVGPIDVWLADNAWWGLDVCCAVIANEGWRREDGTFEGSNLVSQQKGKYSSDVPQSSEGGSK